MVPFTTSPEVVNALKADGRFTADQPTDEYMAKFAQRLQNRNGAVIEYTDADSFVSEMVCVGWLKPLEYD